MAASMSDSLICYEPNTFQHFCRFSMVSKFEFTSWGCGNTIKSKIECLIYFWRVLERNLENEMHFILSLYKWICSTIWRNVSSRIVVQERMNGGRNSYRAEAEKIENILLWHYNDIIIIVISYRVSYGIACFRGAFFIQQHVTRSGQRSSPNGNPTMSRNFMANGQNDNN